MQYPPRLSTDPSGLFKLNSTAIGPDVLEEIPSSIMAQCVSRYDLIHFDLDPQNSEQARVP